MYWIEPIIEKIGRNAVDGFACPAAKGVVSEAGREAGFTDPGQLISRVPSVGRRDPGIGSCGQVPVKIVGLGDGTECRLLVIGVVVRRRESRRNV